MIAVECYADTRLVSIMGAKTASIRHAGGKGQVLDVLRKGRAEVGLVDEDPGSIEYPEMRNYRLMEKLEGIRLLRHTGTADKRVIVICPRLEDWMLERARTSGVDPSEFGLAVNPRALHASGRYDRHPHFPRFIEKLLEVDTEFKKLRDWIR